MESLRVKDLREIAKSKGLKGWYRLRKSDLISFITSEEQHEQKRQRELEEVETQTERCRRERLEKVAAEANAKAEKKAKSKACRQAKQDEAGGKATSRDETG